MWRTGPSLPRALSLTVALAAVALVPGSSTAKPAVPSAGFFAQSAAVLGNEMWVLGVDHCGASSGCAAVMHSTNGGRTFARVGPGPARWLHDIRRYQTPNVFFANPRDGYAFAFTDAVWATHDAARTWKRLPLPTPLGFAVGARTAYAVTANCSRVPCTDFRLQRSDAGTDRWSSAPLPVRSDGPLLQLDARGAHVWIVARGNGRNTLARLDDSGRTFTTGAAPCQESGANFEAAPDASLWIICSHGGHGSAFRSTDGGAHFAPVALSGLGNGARFGAASAQVAVVSPTGAWATLRRTADGGRTWRQGWRAALYTTWLKWIAFGDARHGALLLLTTTNPQLGISRFGMWRTGDAGARWSSVRFL